MVRSARASADTPWKGVGGKDVVLPDGSVLRVDGVDQRLTEPWFVSARFTVGVLAGATSNRETRGLMVAPVGVTDHNVRVLLDGDYVGEYTRQGGTVLVAARADRTQSLIAWQGRWHEAWSWVNVEGASQAQCLALLDGLTFSDSPRGLRVGLGRGMAWERIDVLKNVPGVGELRFERPELRVDDIPRWAGARVRGGEAWRQSLPDDVMGAGRSRIVLVGPQAWVTVLNTAQVADDAGLELVSAIEAVSWA